MGNIYRIKPGSGLKKQIEMKIAATTLFISNFIHCQQIEQESGFEVTPVPRSQRIPGWTRSRSAGFAQAR